MRTFSNRVVVLSLLTGLCATGFLGCGGGPSFKLTPVTGTVKLNGAPLADADVQFVYDGTLPEGFYGSTGKTDANGKYELITGGKKGTIAGKFKVLVSKITDKSGGPPKVQPDSGIDIQQMILSGDAVESIPPAYSDIAQAQETAEVVDGTPLVRDIEITK